MTFNWHGRPNLSALTSQNAHIQMKISSQKGISIKCFECNSNLDPLCASSNPPAHLAIDCSTVEATKGVKQTICRKTKLEIEIAVSTCK